MKYEVRYTVNDGSGTKPGSVIVKAWSVGHAADKVKGSMFGIVKVQAVIPVGGA